MNTEDQTPAFEGWAVLELMGHRRLGGWLSEAVVAGSAFVRIDVPGPGEDPIATQFYAPSAVYCITPTTEATAHAVARLSRPEPVTRWELERAGVVADEDDASDELTVGEFGEELKDITQGQPF